VLVEMVELWKLRVGLETNILPPTPHPCQGKKKLIHNLFGEIKAFETKLKFWQRQLCQYVFDILSMFAKCTWRR